MAFLEKIAHQIWERYHTEVREHLFLFPSRRSMLYFKRAVTRAAGQNLWMPDCTTLEKWILDQSDLLQIDSITAAFELYKSARKVNFTSFDFEGFYPLARIILDDFEQVDLALIDTDKFWTHTSAWQDMAEQEQIPPVWEKMNNTPLKESWIVNWNKLKSLYNHFTYSLESNGLSTKGSIYRRTAQQVEYVSPFNYRHIHVIGFSHLSKAEVKVLEHFQSKYQISFYWYIPSQMKLPSLDAGEEVLNWAKHFGQEYISQDSDPPKIQVIRTSGIIPQMKEVSQKLSMAEGSEEQMAVLLPQPTLIDLFLKSFPDNRSKVNISLGYPLIYSPVRSLLEWILILWKNMEENHGRMNRSDLERIWSHTYVANYLEQKNISLQKSGQLYFQPHEMEKEDAFFVRLYTPLPSQAVALVRLNEIIEILIPAQPEVFHREVLRYMKGRLVRMLDVLTHVKNISILFLKRILVEMMQTASVPFRGEPMEGVQALGVQEVQNLSFDTLIIPGMNEEILPAGKIKSLIPFSLRRHYGLEDQGKMHSIQSYYIWSAILQARNIYLLYSHGDDLLGAKGISRYIFQLKYGGLNIPLTERFVDLELDGFESGHKEILMNKKQEAMLLNYLQNDGLSPTALMSYIRCPFQFFLRYVLRITEKDIPAPGLDYRDMGTVIHDVMYDLYSPWVGKEIKKEDFRALKGEIAPLSKGRYQRLYPSDSQEALSTGVHWMEQEIIIRAVERFVEFDAKIKDLRIDILEGNLEQKISTHKIKDIRLHGKIDRLDHVNGAFRVIDYKTGNSHLNSKKLPALWNERNPSHNWQLLFYAFLLKDRLGESTYEMGHYTLKEKQLYASMKTNGSTRHSSKELNEFESTLIEIIGEMADPDIPYIQTDKVSHCKHCVFNTFCERQGSH